MNNAVTNLIVRDFLSGITSKISQSRESHGIYDEVKKVVNKYQVMYFYDSAPFTFVNPKNGWTVKVNNHLHSPVFIQINDDTFLGQDCMISAYYTTQGYSNFSDEANKRKSEYQIWYNYNNGDLTSVVIINSATLMCKTYDKKNGIWNTVYELLENHSLPDNIEKATEILGKPILFQIDPKAKLDEFLRNSGLIDFDLDLKKAWPCARCGKPKSKHRGNAIKYYISKALY